MVAMKVLWDMWRNLTSATANWSFSGPPNGTNVTKPAGVSGGSGNRRRLRYNRLCSGGPTKSRSQPANLAAAAAALEETTLSSSEESLAGWTEAENKLKHSSTFPFQSHVIKQRTSNPKGDTCNDRLTTGNEPKPDQAPLETAWPAANSNGAAKTSSDFGVEDEDDDEMDQLTCDVCGRAFSTLKRLVGHQRKKRHYGCIQCDSIFPSREGLECHREQMSHYEHAIPGFNESDNESDFFLETDDDENGLGAWTEDGDDEERERLL